MANTRNKFVRSNSVTDDITMSQECVDESNIFVGRRTQSGRLSENNHFLLFCIDYPRNSSALSPPLFLGAIPVLDAVFASFDSDNSPGNVWPNSTIVTTETPGKDEGDPQLEPHGDDATIEAVGETGTTNAPTADDAPTGNMEGT
jgi:hypothetical protein